MNKIEYNGLHHASFLVSDLQRSLDFYCDLLGLKLDKSRPDIGFKGAWLKIGAHEIHLLELTNPDPLENRPEHVGRDRHVAVSIKNIDAVIQMLEDENIFYTKSKSGRAAIFFRDPDANGLEFVQH